MRYLRNGQILLAVTLAISTVSWGQAGGRRGAQAQQAAPAGNAPGRGAAVGAGAAPASGVGDFFSYDTTAGSGLAIPDSQPVETHQKIALNGETLAYTAR